MSNFGSMPGRRAPVGLPTPPRGETIARYATYLEAQRAVDFLSDNKFPVQFVTIVGTGLRMVERVTGRLTYSRVAVAGAASGAWFGLMIGLLLSLFATTGGTTFLPAIILGAGFGLLFSVISYSLTGGRRDFTSTSQVVATEYEVLCLPEQAQSARELLWRLPGGRGQGGDASATHSQPGDRLGAWGGQGALPGSGAPGSQARQAPWGSPGSSGTPDNQGTQGTAAPTGTPGTPATSPPPYGSPAPTGSPVPGEPPAAAQQPVSGPTYGEMIEKQKRERAERERAEREAAARGEG